MDPSSATPPSDQSTSQPATPLEALRGTIDHIDEQLVRLLHSRRAAVQQIADIKRAHDLPTYHPAREENLISARRAQAQAAGLDPDEVEEVFRLLLRQSRAGQIHTLGHHAVRPGARILIVGGRGSMGRFFADWFRQSDYEVRILDRDDWPAAEQLASGAHLALLAVPIDATSSVARQLAPLLPHDCILSDITSLKREPLAAMLGAFPGPVIGLHPLFGPATATMDKQITVFCPGRNPEAGTWFLDQLSRWGNVLVETTPEEHDDTMAIVQALRHFATFAFGQFLHRRRVPIMRTLELSSPIYRLELGMVGRLFAQDPSLYAEIVFATPERLALLKEYIHLLSESLPMVERGDKAAFMAQFREIAAWFGPFSEQAMRESTFLIDKLVHRF